MEHLDESEGLTVLIDAWRKETDIIEMLAKFAETRSISLAVDICDKLIEEEN